MPVEGVSIPIYHTHPSTHPSTHTLETSGFAASGRKLTCVLRAVLRLPVRLVAVTVPVTVPVAVPVVMVMVVVMVVVVVVTVVLLVLHGQGGGGLVAGGQVEPALVLQLPPDLVSLRLQPGHQAPDELLLEGWREGEEGGGGGG